MDNISAFNAKEYNNKIQKTIPYYEDMYKQIADIVTTCEYKNIVWLDVGCGTGKMAEIAMQNTDVKRMVLCDISAKMLDVAGKNYTSDRLEFRQQNILDMCYNKQFDVVTAVQVNHYFRLPQRKQAVKNCFSALKDNGIFITFENFAPNSKNGTQLFINRWYCWQIRQGKGREECKQHIERYNKDYFPITINEHLQLIRECGFKSAEIFWLSYMQVGILAIK